MDEVKRHEICEWEPSSPLGYYGDIEMVASTCCHAPVGVDRGLPNFCIECGNRSIGYMHGRGGKPRPQGRCKAFYVYSDEEDGALWRCGHCQRKFTTEEGDAPSWCAVCGIEFEPALVPRWMVKEECNG